MKKIINNIDHVVAQLEIGLTIIAGCSLVIIMLITAVDVFMRYFMHQPLGWWYDVLTNYVMVALFYLAFSDTLRRSEHLTIDGLSQRLSFRTRIRILVPTYLIIGPLMISIGVIGLESSLASFRTKEVLAGLIPWPVWPTKAIAGIAFVILGIRCCLMINQYFNQEPDEKLLNSKANEI